MRHIPCAIGGIFADVLLVGLPLLPIAAYASDPIPAVAGVGIVLILLAVIFAVVIYFLPTIIASCRHVTGSGWVLFVNVFFGWTIVGWWGCLLWAAFGQTRAQKAFYERHLSC